MVGDLLGVGGEMGRGIRGREEGRWERRRRFMVWT